MKRFDLNILVEDNSGLNLLIQPFTDTFKAAGLSFISIANSLSFATKTLVAGFLLSTERIKSLNTAYTTRQDKINARYKSLDLMKKAGPDFHVVSFLADPSTYLGAASFSVIKNTLVDIGGSVGLGLGSSSKSDKIGRNNMSAGDIKMRLDSLFGFTDGKAVREERINPRATGALLVEREQGVREQDAQGASDKERAEAIEAIAEKTQTDFNDWFNNKLKQVQLFNELNNSYYQLFNLLQKAETIEELKDFFALAKENNFNAGEEKIKSLIQAETQKLLNEPSFKKDVPKDIKGDADKELKFAGSLVFVAAKKDLTKYLQDIIDGIRKNVISILLEDMPPRSDMGNANPNMEKLIKLRDQIEKEYSIPTSKSN